MYEAYLSYLIEDRGLLPLEAVQRALEAEQGIKEWQDANSVTEEE